MPSKLQTTTVLGQCPHCESQLHRGDVLIQYETSHGETAYWADCPNCGQIVHPA